MPMPAIARSLCAHVAYITRAKRGCWGVETWILVVFAATLVLIAAAVVQMLPDESAIASTLHIPIGVADHMSGTSAPGAEHHPRLRFSPGRPGPGQDPRSSTPDCVPAHATAEQLVAGSEAGSPLCPGINITGDRAGGAEGAPEGVHGPSSVRTALKPTSTVSIADHNPAASLSGTASQKLPGAEVAVVIVSP